MVLIDMQKPKSCDECRFCEYEQGHCTAFPVGEWRRIEDVSECPLVEVETEEHLPCYLDGPCEYQNKDIIVPSCSWCKHCNSEGVCAYWGTARVCEDTTPCSHYELDKQFFKEERTIER